MSSTPQRADMTTILIVDDERAVRFTLAQILAEEGYQTLEAADVNAALALSAQADLILTDLVMPDQDGVALIEALKARGERSPVIVLTARGSEREAVRAMRAGAYDYLPKPFELDELLSAVTRALELAGLRQDAQLRQLEHLLGRPIIAHSQAMRAVLKRALRLAQLPISTLVHGESGVGKEAVAELLHLAGPRAHAPLVRFNCAALSDELAAAELFGHEKGAFTGAHVARPGYFRKADQGTLILDEVAELSPAIQAMLLRVLQSGELQTVGAADNAQPVDVRVVACTHQDLAALVERGQFREDLYYRLCVVELVVPPLRERVDDIAPLARCFAARDAQRFGLDSVRISDAALALLKAHLWPGNVRELEHTITRALALYGGPIIEPEALLISADKKAHPDILMSYRAQLERFEREVIERALKQAQGNQSEAARRLELSRSTFLDKLRRLGV